MNRRKDTVLQGVLHDREVLGRELQHILHQEDADCSNDAVQLRCSVADAEVEMYGNADQHQRKDTSSKMEGHSEQLDHRRQDKQGKERNQTHNLANNMLNNIGGRHAESSFQR